MLSVRCGCENGVWAACRAEHRDIRLPKELPRQGPDPIQATTHSCCAAHAKTPCCHGSRRLRHVTQYLVGAASESPWRIIRCRQRHLATPPGNATWQRHLATPPACASVRCWTSLPQLGHVPGSLRAFRKSNFCPGISPARCRTRRWLRRGSERQPARAAGAGGRPVSA